VLRVEDCGKSESLPVTAKVSPHLVRSIWLAAQNSLVNRGRQC
jgi:hypothetical protein